METSRLVWLLIAHLTVAIGILGLRRWCRGIHLLRQDGSAVVADPSEAGGAKRKVALGTLQLARGVLLR